MKHIGRQRLLIMQELNNILESILTSNYEFSISWIQSRLEHVSKMEKLIDENGVFNMSPAYDSILSDYDTNHFKHSLQSSLDFIWHNVNNGATFVSKDLFYKNMPISLKYYAGLNKLYVYGHDTTSFVNAGSLKVYPSTILKHIETNIDILLSNITTTFDAEKFIHGVIDNTGLFSQYLTREDMSNLGLTYSDGEIRISDQRVYDDSDTIRYDLVEEFYNNMVTRGPNLVKINMTLLYFNSLTLINATYVK